MHQNSVTKRKSAKFLFANNRITTNFEYAINLVESIFYYFHIGTIISCH